MGSGQDIEIVRTVGDLRRRIADWYRTAQPTALVPTMGAIHAGHVALVRHARSQAPRTCVTLFVNPKQFGPTEDFTAYPRDEAKDALLLAEAGADLLFAPSLEEIYPPGHATKVTVEGLGDILEGEFRPGFFTGVATVVAKLLLQALPDLAVFGEKDYQQLLVVKRMVADLNIPVRIESVPTVRETDGLAISSRNAYLSPAERKAAPSLFATIVEVAEKIRRGAPASEATAAGAKRLTQAGFGRVDYLTVRDADTLEPIERYENADRRARVLAAAWLGKTRLIDNTAV